MNRTSALVLMVAAIFISAVLWLDHSSASVTKSAPLTSDRIATPRPTASTITVINTNDSGAGSLRQALLDAHDGDTIAFNIPPLSTISLTTGELAINKSVTISGPGTGLLAISRAQGAPEFRILHV